MAKGQPKYIEYKNGEIINIAELARREGVIYSTIVAKSLRNPEASWKELVAPQKLGTVMLYGIDFTVAQAMRILHISRSAVLDRKKKLNRGYITQDDFETVGPLTSQKHYINGSPGNAEWKRLKKNLINGDESQQATTILQIPTGSLEKEIGHASLSDSGSNPLKHGMALERLSPVSSLGAIL